MKLQRSISPYWTCQLAGWSAAALYWGYSGYTGQQFSLWLGILYFITDVLLYVLLTHAYRNLCLHFKWNLLPLGKLLAVLFPAWLILSCCFALLTLLKIYLLRSVFMVGFSQPLTDFFGENIQSVFIAGTRLIAVWLLAYHLYHYARREVMAVQEAGRLAFINKDIQLKNLASQLNPHFLFNSLNNIKSLAIENPVAARRSIDLLAELLRSSLYQGDINLIPLSTEMEIVKDYLELEKFRMEERLQVEISIDDSLGSIPVPRLSIQTLAENAIKHGIEKQQAGGVIKISAVLQADQLQIKVENPGSLTDQAPAGGVGLSNLRERLHLQYRSNANFSITDSGNNLVVAELSIPVA